MRRLLSGTEMRAADNFTIDNLGIPKEELISRAGAALAAEVEKRFPSSATVLAVLGTGSNGSDGEVAADILRKNGYTVGKFYATHSKTGVIYEKYDVILDCLFGTGLNKIVSGKYKTLIESINSSASYVISCDIPSGISADNGKVFGIAVKADLTVSIGELKRGLYFNDGIDYSGEIVCEDIGISIWENNYPYLLEVTDVAELFLPRNRNVNKGTFHRAVAVGGSKPFVGGSILTANALSKTEKILTNTENATIKAENGGLKDISNAENVTENATIKAENLTLKSLSQTQEITDNALATIKSGAGYSAIAVPESLYSVYAGKVPETVIFTIKDDGEKMVYDKSALDTIIEFADVISYGNGISVSKGAYENLKYLLENFTGKLLIDADGLNVLADKGKEILKTKKCQVVITPHVKEFSRISGLEIEEITNDMVEVSKAFAKEYNVTVVLKSAVTVISDGEKIAVNTFGNCGMAKAGSGDVLAGIMLGLLANNGVFESACGAVVLNGISGEFAAKKSNELTITPSEVIQNLPYAVNHLQKL